MKASSSGSSKKSHNRRPSMTEEINCVPEPRYPARSVNIKVGIRCRTFSIEDDLGVHLIQHDEEEGEVNLLNSSYSTNRFGFNWCWWSAFGWQQECKGRPPEAESMKLIYQKDIYDACGRGIKANLYNGEAEVLFGYGLSGSGKTFTLYGPDAVDSPEAWFKHPEPHPLWGIFPRLLYEIFHERQDGWRVKMKYLQNVKDIVRDLMSPTCTEKQYKVGMKKDVDGFTDFDWLCQAELYSWDEFREKFIEANARKVIASTQFNHQSACGHCILRLDIEIPNQDDPAIMTHGHLFLCDLAGTQPAGDVYSAIYKKNVLEDGVIDYQLIGPDPDNSKTNELRDQMKKVNLSLAEMGQFFYKLAGAIKDKKLKPGKSLPGCNSYFLCKFLKGAMLQGNTNLICAIRPEVTYHKYTFATLGFAKNASPIKLQPRRYMNQHSASGTKLDYELEKTKALGNGDMDTSDYDQKESDTHSIQHVQILHPFFLLWDHETSPEEWWDEGKSWEKLGFKTDIIIKELIGITTDDHGNVKAINRHSCGLIGLMPNSLSTFTFLEELDVSENSLTGQIPTLKNLKVANFSNNNFSGDAFLESVVQLVSLVDLNISNNQISGDASALSELKKLKVLNISSNNLSGNLPQSLSMLRALECLDFSSNKMTGDLSFLSALSHLKSLDLSDNEFGGSLPQLLSELTSLEILKMSNNQLTDGVTALYNLKEIHLAGNGFGGNLLESMREFTRVEVLDLSNNKLTGSLDPLSALIHLKRAHLSRNMFSGTLPQDFLSQSKILLLDLSFNPQIKGAIPQSLLNNRSMHIAIEGTGLYSIDVSLNVPQFDLYMVPRQTLFELERLEIHEEAQKANLIVVLDVKKKFEIWARRDNGLEVKRDAMVFISHRWLSKSHPDDTNNSKLRHLRRLAKEHPDWNYFWVDYLCVPQDPTNRVLQQNAINSLPNYVKSCGTLVTICGNEGEASLDVYKSRGWCRLEQISSQIPLRNAEGSMLTTWLLICNKDNNTTHPMQELASSELNPLKGKFFDPHDKIKLTAVVRTMCNVMIENETPDLEGWKIRLLGENILKSYELSDDAMKSFQEEADLWQKANSWQKAMDEDFAEKLKSSGSMSPLQLMELGSENLVTNEQLQMVLKAVQDQKQEIKAELARLRKDMKEQFQHFHDLKERASFSSSLRTKVSEARDSLLSDRDEPSNPKVISCAECETQVASVLCISCDDPFCNTCWATFHKKGKRKDHVTQLINT